MLFNSANILQIAESGNQIVSWSLKTNSEGFTDWILVGDIFKLIGIDPHKKRGNIS